MPARIPPPPGTVPNERLIFKLALGKPEDKVVGVALVFIYSGSRPRLEIVDAEQGKFAVGREFGNIKVEISPGKIGEAVLFNALDKGNHFGYMLGGLADDGGAADAHPVSVGKKSLGVQFGDLQYAFAPLTGALYHFVVALVVVAGKMPHVGNIHYMGDVKTGAAQGAYQNIVKHIGPQIADVGVIVHRGAAAVKANFSRPQRFKGLPRAAKGIKKTKSHYGDDTRKQKKRQWLE